MFLTTSRKFILPCGLAYLWLWKWRENNDSKWTVQFGEHSNPYYYCTKALKRMTYAQRQNRKTHMVTEVSMENFDVTGGLIPGRDGHHYPYDWFDDCDPGYRELTDFRFIPPSFVTGMVRRIPGGSLR